ncbi:zinc ribbon domain-containing protein [candidate division KSB1 bacterium]
MKQLNYVCPKCKNTQYETGEIRASGGFWSKIFDVQGRKFTTIICSRCTYTEFYKGDTKTIENVFDFFTN